MSLSCPSHSLLHRCGRTFNKLLFLCLLEVPLRCVLQVLSQLVMTLFLSSCQLRLWLQAMNVPGTHKCTRAPPGSLYVFQWDAHNSEALRVTPWKNVWLLEWPDHRQKSQHNLNILPGLLSDLERFLLCTVTEMVKSVSTTKATLINVGSLGSCREGFQCSLKGLFGSASLRAKTVMSIFKTSSHCLPNFIKSCMCISVSKSADDSVFELSMCKTPWQTTLCIDNWKDYGEETGAWRGKMGRVWNSPVEITSNSGETEPVSNGYMITDSAGVFTFIWSRWHLCWSYSNFIIALHALNHEIDTSFFSPIKSINGGWCPISQWQTIQIHPLGSWRTHKT